MTVLAAAVSIVALAPATPAGAVLRCEAYTSGPSTRVLTNNPRTYLVVGGGSIFCDNALATAVVVTLTSGGIMTEPARAASTSDNAFARAESPCPNAILSWSVIATGSGASAGDAGAATDSSSNTLDCTSNVTPPTP